MRPIALALTLALVSSSAMAETVVVGCPLVQQYSDFQVNMLLGQAREAIGDGEAAKIEAKYHSLKSECRTNSKASRAVAVPPALRQLLADNGIDIRGVARVAAK